MYDYFFCKKISPYTPLLGPYTIINFRWRRLFGKITQSYKELWFRINIFYLEPYHKKQAYTNQRINRIQIYSKLMQCVIFTLHDYFNFKMIKITYIDPVRLFGAVRLFWFRKQTTLHDYSILYVYSGPQSIAYCEKAIYLYIMASNWIWD